ncbi:hypothetical protein K2X33_08735 [bacterium]|nr:hypothetical protein [bacterium]
MRVFARNFAFGLYAALAVVPNYALGATVLKPFSFECPFERLGAVHPELSRFKAAHLNEQAPMPVDNEAFYQRHLHFSDDQNALYFHSENAVLKLLNDKVFEDKELSAATLSLYKKIFFETLAKDAFLVSRIPEASKGGYYSDFKVIRLAIVPHSTAERDTLEQSLKRLHHAVNIQFANEIESVPELKALYSAKTGLVSDASHWHLSGMGKTPAEASWEARRARKSTKHSGQPVEAVPFNRLSIAHTSNQLTNMETLRAKLEESITDPRLWADHAPTSDLLDIFRRASTSTQIHNHDEYLGFIQKRVDLRFGVSLSRTQAEQLHLYYNHLMDLAPSLFIREQEPVNLAALETATHGLVSFDISGQSNENIRGTAQALYQAHLTAPQGDSRKLVELSLELASERQMAESDRFEESKLVLMQAIAAAHLQSGRFSASGDDAAYLPREHMSIEALRQLYQQLLDRAPYPAKFRSVVLPQYYEDTSLSISKEQRFRLVSLGEGMEKSIRELLETGPSVRLPYSELKSTLFVIHLRPASDGIHADVFYTSKNIQSLGPRFKHAVEKAARESLPEGFLLGNVTNLRVRPVEAPSAPPAALQLPGTASNALVPSLRSP